MNILKIAYKETIGLFIDDGALALWSLILIAAIGTAAEFHIIDGTVGAVLLFVGCLLILTESVIRAARSRVRKD